MGCVKDIRYHTDVDRRIIKASEHRVSEHPEDISHFC